MLFGLLHEGEPPTPQRYREMIDEAVFAEEMGFDIYGLPEIHLTPGFGISAPEVLLAAVAERTSRIRLRTAGTLLLNLNHPVRVAEQLSTLDIISDGRAELGAARSNDAKVCEAFGIDPNETRAQWAESLEVILSALTTDPFEHHGTFWDIPPRSLTPKPIQRPHPPVFSCSTSLEGHRIAGEKGLGVMMGGSLLGGWQYVEQATDEYKRAIRDPKPIGSYVLNRLGVYCMEVCCAKTLEKAQDVAQEAVTTAVSRIISMYADIGAQSADYSYMAEASEKLERLFHSTNDVSAVNEHGPFISVGDPEFFLERFETLEALGADEVLLTIESMGHDNHLKTIELLGTEVIPAFKARATERNRPSLVEFE